MKVKLLLAGYFLLITIVAMALTSCGSTANHTVTIKQKHKRSCYYYAQYEQVSKR